MLKSEVTGLNWDRLKDYRGVMLKSEAVVLNWDRLKDYKGEVLKSGFIGLTLGSTEGLN